MKTKTPRILIACQARGYSLDVALKVEKVLRSLGAQVRLGLSQKTVERFYTSCTHVLLLGGEDIHPTYYGEKVTHAHANGDVADNPRDEIEFNLAQRAISDGKQLLGICRGMQMITAAAGGKLWQDIQSDTGLRHPWAVSHNVLPTQDAVSDESISGKIFRRSVLRMFLDGKYYYHVNSYHHQALKVKPRGFFITAISQDGIVEGIESKNHCVIGVQWHPESSPYAKQWFRAWIEESGFTARDAGAPARAKQLTYVPLLGGQA